MMIWVMINREYLCCLVFGWSSNCGLDLIKEGPFQKLRTGSEDTVFNLSRPAIDGS